MAGRRKGLAATGAVAVLVLGVLLAVGVLSRGGGGSSPQSSGEVYLTPAASTGPNPFTASLMTQAEPPAPAAPQAPQAPAPPAPQAAAPAPQAPTSPAAAPATVNAPATTLTSVDASVPQLYGGHVGESPCDGGLLRRRLDADSDVATAWAESEGIDRDAVDDFVTGLVSVDLLDDVRVTDWRRVDGRGAAFQVVLERGTTVLVDHYGLPRVRCLSGDPLGLPDRVLQSARFVGTRWARFEPATVIAIVAAPKLIPTLVVLDVSTGKPFGRPIGGDVRTDIDTDTLVADQARLGVSLTLAAPQSPDEAQEVQLSPWGGPPGTAVLAFGTGWPAGDRLLIEPCVGDRPETCALRTDVAVFAVAGPDGSFRAVALRVPGDVRLGDYVEFYVQDTRDDHRGRTFDSPWTVAARDCRDDCAEAAGCHPPFCGGGGGDQAQDQHGCRCVVRSTPVCQIDGCGGGGPKESFAQSFREEPTATPRPHPSGGSSSESKGTQGGHGPGGQQPGGQGSSTHTSSVTTSESATASAQTTSGRTSRSQTTQSSSSHTASQPPPPPTQSSQTTRSSSSQTTHAQPTPQPTPKPTPRPTPPPPTPQPTPRPTPPPPTPAHTPAPTPATTPAPTPKGTPPPGHGQGQSPQPLPSQHPGPTQRP